MKRNQYVTNRLPDSNIKVIVITSYVVAVIFILYAGIWIGQLECVHITKISSISLHFIKFYLNEIFISLMYSLVGITGIGAVVITVTYRRDIYNAQKKVDEIIIKGKEEAVQYKKEGEEIKQEAEKEAEKIVIEARKAEVLWQRKNRELEEKQRQLQREYETTVKNMQERFNDKIRKKGEENRHLAEKCKMLTDELLRRKMKHLGNLKQDNPGYYKREKKRLEQKLKKLKTAMNQS